MPTQSSDNMLQEELRLPPARDLPGQPFRADGTSVTMLKAAMGRKRGGEAFFEPFLAEFF